MKLLQHKRLLMQALEVQGLATTLSQSQFIERARLLLSDQLIDLITPLPALNTALLNAQAGGPSPENDSIAYFDADLLITSQQLNLLQQTCK